MRGVNKATIIGNVGNDPEMKYTASGQAVANFSIATNESWTGKDGQKNERTEWHRIVAWGRLAEICGQYLSKGKPVYVEGSIRTRSWEDRDGNTKYTTEIHAKELQFLGGGQESSGVEKPPQESESGRPPIEVPDDKSMDDDIPF